MKPALDRYPAGIAPIAFDRWRQAPSVPLARRSSHWAAWKQIASRTIWNLHEFGGTVRPKARLLKPHKFQVGEYGSIQRSGAMQRDKRRRFARRGKTFARVQPLTEAQANRATRIVNGENAMRIAD